LRSSTSPPSHAPRSLHDVVEKHMSEVEKTLLYISEARERAERAYKALEEAGADLHLIRATRDAEQALAAEHKRLMQATYFAVPQDDQERFAV
jgi:hypothetical protein